MSGAGPVLRYLSHPEVAIAPAVPVPEWGLHPRGQARIAAVAARGWPAGTDRVISSAERKAREAALPLAEALGLAIEIRPRQGEIDRSSTGYVPHARHEALADRFFGRPEESADGWETARAAQRRVLSDLRAILAETATGDLLIVGHGGVGTLLLCHFAGWAIDRARDQPAGGGYCFAIALEGMSVMHGWQPVETLGG
ncbi:histidine phosphatase family protein [Defluviimonas sp. SAOS-178_SWC]|uniref:histidine phosphatase family protein n=1 Tax=Defluviimonas sp. SAOS-178_SWC TaxID=3121287 RepID=UPI003221F890